MKVALVANARRGWTDCFVDLAPGAHVVVLADVTEVGLEGRLAGFEVRDTIAIVSTSGICFGFLFRKPIAENSVGDQVVATGTGGLNIERCRVGTTKRVPGGLSRTPGTSLSGSVDGSLRRETGNEGGHNPSLGRWPPNLVFVHGEACRKSSDGGDPESGFGWECEPGCPVAALDEQTGPLKNGGQNQTSSRSLGLFDPERIWKGSVGATAFAGDTGGASRFYPQFKNESESLAWFEQLGLGIFGVNRPRPVAAQ